MNENANFIVTYEGYPEFLTQLLNKSIVEKNRLFKVNSWSQDTGALDFYETLDFSIKLYAVMQEASTELMEALKPHDPSIASSIDTCIAKKFLDEYRRVM